MAEPSHDDAVAQYLRIFQRATATGERLRAFGPILQMMLGQVRELIEEDPVLQPELVAVADEIDKIADTLTAALAVNEARTQVEIEKTKEETEGDE